MNIEKFEFKINSIKRKVNSKVFGIIIFAAFTIFVIFTLQIAQEFKVQKELLESEYNRSMYEMIAYIKNIDLQFSKLQITNDEDIAAATLADIWRQSNLAKENLSNLPIAQEKLSNTESFLAQVSDYSYATMKNILETDNLENLKSDEILSLSSSASELYDLTSKIYEELNANNISWDDAEKIGSDELSDMSIWNSIGNMDTIFQDYEGLIYDGAFSEHIEDINHKFLTGDEVTKEDAENKIKEIYNDNLEYIGYLGEMNTNIDIYNFNIKLIGDDNIKNIQITKKGCKVYSIISDKNVTEQLITIDEAINNATKFLELLEIYDMESTYYYITENLISINLAYVQDDIIVYPDLIKVKVALDTGEICSIETAGYMYNHEERIDINPSITIEEARLKINQSIDITSEDLVIIPTDSKDEILCYEFKGEINDTKCIVYINAENGNEEKILMLIETPEGTLTM